MTQLALIADQRTRVGRMRRGLVLAPHQVYVGRPRGGRDPRECTIFEPGYYGNPFPLTRYTPEECLRLYRIDLAERLSGLAFRSGVRTLRGKELLCWCIDSWVAGQGGPIRCHAQILAEVAETLNGEA